MSIWLTYLKLFSEQDRLILKIYWNPPMPVLSPGLLFGKALLAWVKTVARSGLRNHEDGYKSVSCPCRLRYYKYSLRKLVSCSHPSMMEDLFACVHPP